MVRAIEFDVLKTGSSGNAVVINGEILVDCGVPYKTLEQSGYIKGLKLVLLTHSHGDHFNPATARRLHRERPALRWGCCEWMVPPLLEAGVDKYAIHFYERMTKNGKIDEDNPLFNGGVIWGYDFHCALIPFLLFHDVPNCGYKIFIGEEKILYATDTSTLDHIEAKNYDLYMLESNHTRAEIEARIAEKQARGEFAYEARAARNHLSQEQAMDWLARNAGPNSRYILLHQHAERRQHD